MSVPIIENDEARTYGTNSDNSDVTVAAGERGRNCVTTDANEERPVQR
jgi:hypothetical protein